MNKIFLIGNLTADPVKTNSGETTICRFSIAVNRRFTRADAERTVDFFRITVFGKSGDNCATYLAKGRKVAVTGRLEISDYTDKDGNKRQGVDVIADEVEFLTPKGEGGDYTPPSGGGNRDKLEPVSDDSLPF